MILVPSPTCFVYEMIPKKIVKKNKFEINRIARMRFF